MVPPPEPFTVTVTPGNSSPLAVTFPLTVMFCAYAAPLSNKVHTITESFLMFNKYA